MKLFITIIISAFLVLPMSCKTGLNTESGDNATETGHEEGGHEHSAHASDLKHDHENTGEHTEITTVEPGIFSFIYKTSGQVLTGNKDEVIISAASNGIVSFTGHLLYPGVEVVNGQSLFFISGQNMTDYNTGVDFSKTESAYLAARENYERAARLISDKLITQPHYLQYRQLYEETKAEYDNYKKTISGNGNMISSPVSGYIKDLFIREGQMVNTGERLASVITEHNMVLKADIPPTAPGIMDNITAANFTTGYSPEIFSTDEMNGDIISYGKSTGENSFYIPLFFSIDYSDKLIPGTFADVWLIGDTIKGAITIPNTALMEEFGNIYVFRENDHGEYEKIFIETGYSNGKVTHVLKGIGAGDRIVTGGTYRVKLSMQSTGIPGSHGHNH